MSIGLVMIGADPAAVARFAEHGYTIATVDPGDATNVDAVLARTSVAIDALRARPETGGVVAAAGFDIGGPFAFLAATRLGVAAAVTLWAVGFGAFLGDGSRVRVPLSLHFRDDDARVPLTEIRAIKGVLEGFGTTEIYRYATYDDAARDAAERRARAVLDALRPSLG
jgi:dienelactone hydrolase